jgi:hypothetical protein
MFLSLFGLLFGVLFKHLVDPRGDDGLLVLGDLLDGLGDDLEAGFDF